MSTTKIVIVCLCLLLAIFFVGLSLNLIEKPNHGISGENEERQREVASDYKKDSWVNVIDKLLAPFAASLKPDDVNINCSHTKTGFYLSEQTPTCKITVPGFSESFKKLSFRPDKRSVQLKITFLPTDGDEPDPFFWPSDEFDDDTINFVILGNADTKVETVATIFIECNNCSDQRKVKLAFE
jgi:hypothetical protein